MIVNTRHSPYDAPSCKHNDSVVCLPETMDCEKCGWDPDVAAQRLHDIMVQMGIIAPESAEDHAGGAESR